MIFALCWYAFTTAWRRIYIIILYTYKILISVRAAPTYVAYKLFILACAVSMLY